MFKTVTVESVAQLGDTFRRNSIASANEIRKIVGLKPSNDPRADELFNPNIADNNQNTSGGVEPPATDETGESSDGGTDELTSLMNELTEAMGANGE
jgi:hypothetical protein